MMEQVFSEAHVMSKTACRELNRFTETYVKVRDILHSKLWGISDNALNRLVLIVNVHLSGKYELYKDTIKI